MTAAPTLPLRSILSWGVALAALTSCEFWILGPASWIYGYGGMLETIPYHLGLLHSGSVWAPWAPFVAGGVDRLAAWGNADPFNVEPLLLALLPAWAANGLHAFLQRLAAFVFTVLLARDLLRLKPRWCLAAGTAHLTFSYYTFGAMFTSPLLPAVIWGLQQAYDSRHPLRQAALLGLLASPFTSFVHGVPYLLLGAAGWFLLVTPRLTGRFASVFALFALTFSLCESPQLFALLLQAAESSRAQYPAEDPASWSLAGWFYLQPEWDLFNQDPKLKAFGMWVPVACMAWLLCSRTGRADGTQDIGRRVAAYYGLLSLRVLWLGLNGSVALILPWVKSIYMGRFASVAYPTLCAVMAGIALQQVAGLAWPGRSRRIAGGIIVALAVVALLWPKVSLWRHLGVDSPGAGMLDHPQYRSLRMQGGEPFRVASVLDLPPAHAYANGLEAADGWGNLYSGRYRQLWLRILDPLFAALPANKDIFAPDGRRPQDGYIYLGTSLLNPGLGVLPGEDTAAALRDGFDLDRRFRLNLLSLLNVRYLLAEQPLLGSGLALRDKPAAPSAALCRDYATGKVNFPHREWKTTSGSFDFSAWWEDTRRGYEMKLHPPGIFVYENTLSLDRYRCVARLQVLPTAAAVLDTLAEMPVAEMRDTAVAAQPDPGIAGLPAAFAPARATVQERMGDRIRLQVDGTGDRLLVTSQIHNRYWTVRVDGAPRRTLVLNHAFIGVWLRAGESNVELNYRPPYHFLLP